MPDAFQNAFQNARAKRTIFQRTKPRPGLPELVLYMEWIAGRGQRRVKDTEGNEHLLADKVMQSYYRVVGGSKAKELAAKHWPEETAAADKAAVAAAAAAAQDE